MQFPSARSRVSLLNKQFLWLTKVKKKNPHQKRWYYDKKKPTRGPIKSVGDLSWKSNDKAFDVAGYHSWTKDRDMDEKNKNRTDGDENNAQRTISSILYLQPGENWKRSHYHRRYRENFWKHFFLTSYRFSSRQTVNNTAFARESV